VCAGLWKPWGWRRCAADGLIRRQAPGRYIVGALREFACARIHRSRRPRFAGPSRGVGMYSRFFRERVGPGHHGGEQVIQATQRVFPKHLPTAGFRQVCGQITPEAIRKKGSWIEAPSGCDHHRTCRGGSGFSGPEGVSSAQGSGARIPPPTAEGKPLRAGLSQKKQQPCPAKKKKPGRAKD